jgi:hypothetical protein
VPATDCLEPIPWETRNLGLPSFRVSADFLRAPDPPALRAGLDAAGRAGPFFAQARVPKTEHAALPALQRLGFYFVESTLEPFSVLSRNEVLTRFRADPSASVPRRFRLDELAMDDLRRDDPGEVGQMQALVRDVFADDRFHLDPNCDPAAADARFSHWTADLLADPGVTYVALRRRGELIGLGARRGEDAILGGFTRAHAGSGLGEYFWLTFFERAHQSGVPRIQTVISANNTSVLNLYARIGFQFRHPATTLHYWSHPRTAAGAAAA